MIESFLAIGKRPQRLGKRGHSLEWFLTILLLALISRPALAPATDLKLPLIWTVDLKTLLESAATVADLNGDGRDEVLVAGREEIIALNGKGKELWRWHSEGRFMTYPAVLKRRGKPPLIYAANSTGQFICLDGNGRKVWQAKLNGPSSWSAAVVCDLEGDGTPEVIQTDAKGTVWAFEALTGVAIWQAKVKGIPVSPAVGDLDRDGRLDIVVSTGEGILAALGNEGKPKWAREIGGSSPDWATSAPVIFAASDGQARVAAAASEGQIACFDRDGHELWRHSTRGPVASTISVGDLDFDGRADIFLITQIGVVYRFDEGGRLLWDIDMQGRSLAAGAIMDIDGDGRLEYALCTQRGHLLVLNDRGEFTFDYQFDNRTINVTPTFGDVTGKSRGLEMVITGGESGKLFCFGTSAPRKTRAQWTGYRGDVRKTGAWFGLTEVGGIRMVPQNLFWDQVVTGEPVRFVITNPKPGDEPLKARAVCVRPDGSRQVAISTVLGKRGELLMPVDVVVPGTYRFTWSLEDARGRTLFSGSREVSLQPFANARALVERANDALIATAYAAQEIAPRSASALGREAMMLELEARDAGTLQESVPGGDAATVQQAIEKTAALVARARRALRMSDVIEQAVHLGDRSGLIAFEGTMWENRKVDEQLPAQVARPLKVRRRVVPGEHEPAAVSLFNATDYELHVRVQVDAPPPGLTVTPHRSVAVPTALGELSWDALPEMDESGVLSIPSLASREVWLDVEVGAVSAGEHQVAVRFQALNGPAVMDAPTNPHSVPPPEARTEITLNVLPFEMAPPGDFRLCTWSPSAGPEVEDLLAHGNNVFNTPHGTPKYDPQNHLKGIDYTRLDSIATQFRERDVILLLNGFPNLKPDFASNSYKKELEFYLDDLVPHMAGLGVDTDHFALYPIDEPGGHGWDYINRLVEFGKMVRAINPSVMMYVDGGGEAPMFEALAPYMDIWVPGINMLPEKTPEMRIMRTTGKMLWSYNCSYGYARPVGPNIKNTNIIAEFRTAALFALRQGTTGIGYWCYNTGAEDPWTRVKNEYKLVYPGRTGPVTSRRWEAVREGIEDYRILAALRKRLHADGQGQLSKAARDQVRRLLEASLPRMVDQSFDEMLLGLGRSVIDASNNDAVLAEFREEMFRCVEAARE